MGQMGELPRRGRTIQYLRERVIRPQTRGQERQAEETYLSFHEGIDENNRDNGTDERTTKTRAYN